MKNQKIEKFFEYRQAELHEALEMYENLLKTQEFTFKDPKQFSIESSFDNPLNDYEFNELSQITDSINTADANDQEIIDKDQTTDNTE